MYFLSNKIRSLTEIKHILSRDRSYKKVG